MAVDPHVASMARQDTEMNSTAKRLLVHKSSLSSVLHGSFHLKKWTVDDIDLFLPNTLPLTPFSRPQHLPYNPGRLPHLTEDPVSFPPHGPFFHQACSPPPSALCSNITLPIRPSQMLYFRWQPLSQHTLPSFLIFLILYQDSIYFTCLFVLLIVCLLSSPPSPKDKSHNDKEFWVFCWHISSA